MRSVVNQNVVMRRIPVYMLAAVDSSAGDSTRVSHTKP